MADVPPQPAPDANNPPPPAPVPVSGPPPAVPPGFASGIAQTETGGANMAQNPAWPVSRGGPLGPHQFIASTWNAFAKANPQLFAGMSPDQILAARTNPALSMAATNWYASYNAAHLKANGIAPTPQNLAIAHALGGGGASSALKYADTTPLAQIFQETQPGAATAILQMNPQYQRMTLGDLKAKYANLGTGPTTNTANASAPGTNTGDTNLAQVFSDRLKTLQDQQSQLAANNQAPRPNPLPFGLTPPGGNPVATALNTAADAFKGVV